MNDHVYSVTEVVGSSSTSIEDAIRKAIAPAGQSLKTLDWFEVPETRGHIDGGKIGHFQVGLKIGFRLEDD
jgi:flavin-binding protein dodecin